MTDYEIEYQKCRNVCGAPFQEFVVFFQKYKEKNAKILDLGCGQGRDAIFVARHGHEVHGVDISPSGISQMLTVAEKENLKIQGTVASIIDFEISGKYDVIILDRILHMLEKEEIRYSILEKSMKAVRNSGYVLIADIPQNMVKIRKLFKEKAKNWQTEYNKKGFLFVRKVNN